MHRGACGESDDCAYDDKVYSELWAAHLMDI
jgi:hypothetical protein